MAFQLLAIDDLHVSASGVDESCCLQPTGSHRDSGAPRANHLRENALREWNLTAVAAILNFQEPAAEARLD